jgi:hypothetical protein
MQQDQTPNIIDSVFLFLLPMCALFEMTSGKYVEGHLTTAEASFCFTLLDVVKRFGWEVVSFMTEPEVRICHMFLIFSNTVAGDSLADSIYF